MTPNNWFCDYKKKRNEIKTDDERLKWNKVKFTIKLNKKFHKKNINKNNKKIRKEEEKLLEK